MGQYYIVVNVDKKECLNPHDFACGLKLTEFGFVGSGVSNALKKLLLTRWKGDCVYVAGDYADYLEEEEGVEDNYVNFVHEKHNLPKDKTLYAFASDNYTEIREIDDISHKDYRYLVNDNLKEFIDLKELPKDLLGDSLDPLILLIAIGNGQGGGDYFGDSCECVGSWSSTSEFIRFSKEEPNDCERITPDFMEKYICSYC